METYMFLAIFKLNKTSFVYLPFFLSMMKLIGVGLRGRCFGLRDARERSQVNKDK